MSLLSVNLLHLTEFKSLDKILKLMVSTRSKVKSRSHHDVAHLQPPNKCPYQVSTSYTLWLLQKGQRSNQGHTMMLHTYNPQRMSYQVSTSYTLWFLRYSATRFYRSRSLQQGQRSNQGHTMMLLTYTPKTMSLPSINFLHLTVSEI